MRQARSTVFAAALLLVAAAMPSIARAESIEIARGSGAARPQQPQIAIDDAGTIHLVYGVGDQLRYCQSGDGGKSFAEPVDLPLVHELSLGMRRGPRIAAAKSSICVTAIGGKQCKGKDGDVLALRSTDGGKTWSQPVAVNDVPDAGREGLHAMAAGPEGQLCCAWLDLRTSKTEVMAATSTDGGATWSKNVLVYKSPDGNVCECCHPSVAFDRRGQIYVLWRNWLGGSRDMYIASSSNGGKSFAKASKVGGGTWPLDHCPMDGGAIAIAVPGKVVTAWRRDNAIFISLAGQREQRLGAGEQPWIAATSKGPYVVWLEKRGDAALLLAPGSTTPVQMASHAIDPVIASRPTGQGPVVVVWESNEGDDYSIRCKVISEAK